MFWWGLICGLFIGSWIGIFMMAMCVTIKDKERETRETDELQQE